MKQQIAEQTSQLPSLRIAYKNQTIKRRKKKAAEAQKTSENPTELVVPVNKEPLPMFDDYKFKARDHDPL